MLKLFLDLFRIEFLLHVQNLNGLLQTDAQLQVALRIRGGLARLLPPFRGLLTGCSKQPFQISPVGYLLKSPADRFPTTGRSIQSIRPIMQSKQTLNFLPQSSCKCPADDLAAGHDDLGYELGLRRRRGRG